MATKPVKPTFNVSEILEGDRSFKKPTGWRPGESESEFSGSEFEMFDDTIVGMPQYGDRAFYRDNRSGENRANETGIWDKTRTGAISAARRAKSVAKETSEGATTLVKKHPLEALLIGLFVGGIAGYALSRRRHY